MGFTPSANTLQHHHSLIAKYFTIAVSGKPTSSEHLACNVVPLHQRACVQDLIADKLQNVGIQLLQGFRQLAICACRTFQV